MYDPESPIQDSDIEMAELQAAADRAKALRRAGQCDHGWTGPAGDSSGAFECRHCGQRWPNEAARDLAIHDAYDRRHC